MKITQNNIMYVLIIVQSLSDPSACQYYAFLFIYTKHNIRRMQSKTSNWQLSYEIVLPEIILS